MTTRFVQLLIAWIAALALLAFVSPAWGVLYYVRTSGNDANAGTSAAAAYLTVSRALSAAVAGDTIYVGAGTYTGQLAPPRSGTLANPIRVYGDTDGSRTGDAGTVTITHGTAPVISFNGRSYVQFVDLTISGASTTVDLATSSNIRLERVTVRDCTGTGAIRLQNSTLTFAGGFIRAGTGYGISVGTSSSATLTGVTIRDLGGIATQAAHANAVLILDGCTLQSNSGAACSITAGGLTLINTIIRDSTTGVVVNGTSATAQIWHNVFYAMGGSGVSLQSGTATVRNNLFSSGRTAVQRTGGTLTHSHNGYSSMVTNYSGTTAGAGDITASPGFIDTTEFRVATTSSCVNAGFDGTGVVSTDRDGKTRPIGGGWDIGLYEFGTPTGPKPRLTSWSEIETTSP